MDYVQAAFYEASGWDVDNSYSALTATAQGTPLVQPTTRTSRS